MFAWLPWNRRHRAEVRNRPVPAEWCEIIARNVPLADRLDDEQRAIFRGQLNVFMDLKTFEGCGGLELTDAIRVTIAAHAVLLLVGLDVDVPFPGLDAIRVYPSAYRVPAMHRDGYLVHEGDSNRLGESSGRGYVVLSWPDVLRGGRVADDAHNVVLHEFAHQLDQEDGRSDGAPILPDPNLYGPWAKHLGAAFEELREDVAHHRRSVLDHYGALNPAEFFAVATETFFERPKLLQSKQPDLYAVLARYYRQDPASVDSKNHGF